MSRRPTVLCLSGHDPGGGAGLQADIEAVAALGGHAATLLTAHTVQDTRDVRRVVPADFALLKEQAAILLADVEVHAIKVGLLGEPGQAAFIARLAERLGVPLVLDPVLRAGGGTELATDALADAIRDDLLPRATVLTPNAAEARRLAGSGDLAVCGEALLAAGAANVLITGGDEPGEAVVNRWHRREGSPRAFSWPRLRGPFHGAGCTLASAIAALLARGFPVDAALADAQAWVHAALGRAFSPGHGRPVPHRGPGRLP
jgi:hydroxymethylpyrimidine/phosphomethylpyrimidine kinase